MQNLTSKLSPSFIVDRSKSGRGRYQLDGKPLTGVTTITGVQDKPFLVTWAAKLAYLDSFKKTKKEIRDVLKLKNYAHVVSSKESTDKGTIAHDYIERFIKHYIEKGKYKREKIEKGEIQNSVYRFYAWAKKEKVEFIGSEVSVYSQKFWFAGSFDFICKINGKLLLGDFKTSKQIDGTYFAQGAGYIIAVEELDPELKFDGIVIVRSTLAKEDKVWYQKSSSGKAKKMVLPAFEVAYKYELEREKTYFLSLLNVYRYGRQLSVGGWHHAPVVEYTNEDHPVELTK